MVENFAGDSQVSKKTAAADPEREQLINQLARDMVSSKDLFASPAAPDNLAARYGLVTIGGIEKLPAGILHAGKEAVTHPLQTLEMGASAAAMGAVLKTVLPEAGPAGKIAGLAIGAYFTYEAAKPVVQSYKYAANAKTMNDLDLASAHLGDAGGSFLVNSAIAGAGYKLGAAGAERMLLRSEFDGFADAKQAFWDNVSDKAGKVTGSITDALGMTTSAEPIKTSGSLTLNPKMEGMQKFLPSERSTPQGDLQGEVPANEVMDVTVQLKSKSSDLAMDRALKRLALGRANPMNDAEFTNKFGATQESLDEVSQFAKENNLQVSEANLSSGRVVLKGTAGQFSEAFQTQLNSYELNGTRFIGREGALAVPNSMANHIEGIFGLDERPQASSHAIRLADLGVAKPAALKQGITGPNPGDSPQGPGRGPLDPKSASGYLPNEVGDAYNFPKNTTGKGGGVAIVELGGGIDMANEKAYYDAHGLPMPDIKVIEVGSAKNAPGGPADGEVSLDSQVIGAVAPDAKQTIIFGENSDQGFIDAVTRGSFPEAGENTNQAISISWGGAIENWSDQGKRGMSLAFKKAALKGISVFAAAGDDGAIDNAQSGKFNVDYPSADPYAMGTGGTRLVVKNGKVASEVAWNNGEGRGATGGGISPDAVPDYQKGLKMPPNANDTGIPGRGVPDFAADADPVTGYKIRVGGEEQIIGGTSAVAPLMAALTMRLNEGLGKPVGFMNPFLYKQALAGNAPFFNDITSGSNNGYNTAKGWDPVTGWGSINGEKLLSSYKGEGSSLSTRLSSYIPEELKTRSDFRLIPMNVHVPVIANTNDNKKTG